MTQATDTDIRDIKTAIDNLTKSTESISRSTEANTKAISDLKDSISSLSEVTKVGLTRLDGDIRELRAEIGSLDAKFDERTKVGFWGFILRGTVLAIIIGVGGYLLPIVAEYVHKLPSP
jgi:predicted RNase H-like nuclease (RuvC/YqgF family)